MAGIGATSADEPRFFDDKVAPQAVGLRALDRIRLTPGCWSRLMAIGDQKDYQSYPNDSEE